MRDRVAAIVALKARPIKDEKSVAKLKKNGEDTDLSFDEVREILLDLMNKV